MLVGWIKLYQNPNPNRLTLPPYHPHTTINQTNRERDKQTDRERQTNNLGKRGIIFSLL
jgi:hypothetical protein